MTDHQGQAKTKQLLEIVGTAKSVLILTHTNPDPDAMGAAFGLRHLLMHNSKRRITVAYDGIIGRAENNAMLQTLRLKPVRTSKVRNRKFDTIILCDAQPDAKDPRIFAGRPPDIVLDHHPTRRRKIKKTACYMDIRTDYGATSSIVTEYLRELEIPLTAQIATALYYGIKTDISDIARAKSDFDLEAMRFLFPKISVRWLYRIESPRLPGDYFRVNARAANAARIFKDAVVVSLGDLPQTDYVAEIADYMMRLDKMRWSFVVGRKEGQMVFSVRTLHRAKDAGLVAQKLARKWGGSGGGHKQSAAGNVDISKFTDEQKQDICKQIVQRFLALIGNEGITARPIFEPQDNTPSHEMPKKHGQAGEAKLQSSEPAAEKKAVSKGDKS